MQTKESATAAPSKDDKDDDEDDDDEEAEDMEAFEESGMLEEQDEVLSLLYSSPSCNSIELNALKSFYFLELLKFG